MTQFKNNINGYKFSESSYAKTMRIKDELKTTELKRADYDRKNDRTFKLMVVTTDGIPYVAASLKYRHTAQSCIVTLGLQGFKQDGTGVDYDKQLTAVGRATGGNYHLASAALADACRKMGFDCIGFSGAGEIEMIYGFMRAASLAQGIDFDCYKLVDCEATF